MELHQTVKRQQSLIFSKVFMWMFSGVIISFITGVLISSSGFYNIITKNTSMIFVIMIGQILTCLFFGFCLRKFSVSVARAMFILYSVMLGFTISVVMKTYTSMSIFSALCGTAGMFILLAVYGFTTKRDVSGWGKILSCALIASLVASFVNLFILKSTMFETLINAGTIILFSFFIIYDVNHMKKELEKTNDPPTIQKLQIYFAFGLYVDFIVLFLRLLELFGDRD